MFAGSAAPTVQAGARPSGTPLPSPPVQMPLIACPECARQVSTAATACPGCGHPVGAPVAVAPAAAAPIAVAPAEPRVNPLVEPPAEDPKLPATWACTACGARTFVKLSLLHEEGSSRGTSTTRGIGVGVSRSGVGVGIGASATRSEQQSHLARRAAPPDRAAFMKAHPGMARGANVMVVLFIVAVLAGVATGSFLVGAIGTVVAIAIAAVATPRKEAEAAFAKAFSEWERGYMCRACGAVRRIDAAVHAAKARAEGGDPQLDMLLRSGQRIQAIQHLTSTRALSLADAKAMADARQRELTG